MLSLNFMQLHDLTWTWAWTCTYTDLMVKRAKLDKHAKHIASLSNECLSTFDALWHSLTQLINWGGKRWSLWAELLQGLDHLLSLGTGWLNSLHKLVVLVLQLGGLITAVPKLGVACQEAVTLTLQPLQVLHIVWSTCMYINECNREPSVQQIPPQGYSNQVQGGFLNSGRVYTFYILVCVRSWNLESRPDIIVIFRQGHSTACSVPKLPHTEQTKYNMHMVWLVPTFFWGCIIPWKPTATLTVTQLRMTKHNCQQSSMRPSKHSYW